MTTDRPPLDDPRVLALARGRAQVAHEGAFLPTWDEVPADDQELALLDARNYLHATIKAGLVPATPPATADQRSIRDTMGPADGQQKMRLLDRLNANTTPMEAHAGLAAIYRELADEQEHIATTDSIRRRRNIATARRLFAVELRRKADEAQQPDAEAPLSPYMSHPACGFHWHGRDGMDVPIRDGQPVCPRCELRTVRDTIERVRAVLETAPVVGQSALEYRGLIAFALMADEAQQAEPEPGKQPAPKRIRYLTTPCAACKHPYSWHAAGVCQVDECGCIAFAEEPRP